MKTTFLTVLLALSAYSFCLAQSTYTNDPAASKVSINGTSNLHEWNMDAGVQEIQAKVTYEGGNTVGIEALSVSFLSKDVQSGNKIMDGKTHDALNAEKYRNITLRSTSAASITPFGNNFKGTIPCKLSIAGQSKDIVLQFSGNMKDKNHMHIEGKHSLEMSDFRIKPPTAMMGSLKTGNEIIVAFDVQLKRTEK